MTKRGLAVVAAFAGLLAQNAAAETVLEGTLGYSASSRGGSAINTSGFPFDELTSSQALSYSGLAAIPVGNGMLVQIELGGELTNAPDFTGFFPTDDASTGYAQLGTQFGWQGEGWYGGAFAAIGRTRFTFIDEDQNATYHAFGLAGARDFGDWRIGGQIGALDSSADNPETLSDAAFVNLTASRFFNQGNTALSLNLGYASGDQDADSGTPDQLDLLAFGIGVEHALNPSTSLFAMLDHIKVDENNGTAIESADETRLTLGVKIRLGASSPADRARRTAPDLPAFGRWLGNVPVVD